MYWFIQVYIGLDTSVFSTMYWFIQVYIGLDTLVFTTMYWLVYIGLFKFVRLYIGLSKYMLLVQICIGKDTLVC